MDRESVLFCLEKRKERKHFLFTEKMKKQQKGRTQEKW